MKSLNFDNLPPEEQARITERLTTLNYESLTVEEQGLLRERLKHGAFCGYPFQMWIGQGGPVRKGDLMPPAFSTPPYPARKPVKAKGWLTVWLKTLFGRRLALLRFNRVYCGSFDLMYPLQFKGFWLYVVCVGSMQFKVLPAPIPAPLLG